MRILNILTRTGGSLHDASLPTSAAPLLFECNPDGHARQKQRGVKSFACSGHIFLDWRMLLLRGGR